MEIAECIFHFNDKEALDDQSFETSAKVYIHFWAVLSKNPLVKEFLPKDIFHFHAEFQAPFLNPAYAAAVLFQNVNSLEVYVRTVGLDGWKTRIHASSHGRERIAVPNIEEPAIMDQGPIEIHHMQEVKTVLNESLRESESNNKGERRRRTSGNEGNQKTPSFFNEKLGQSIQKVVFREEAEVGEQSAYGGTTDVGMHTGAKKRNTAAPLVFSLASTMMRLAGRPENEFKAVMAIYLISFLDELPKLTTYNARAIDRYIIVMREAKLYVEAIENKNLQDKILEKMRTCHQILYNIPYDKPRAQLKGNGVSTMRDALHNLFAPEFPTAPLLVLPSESKSRLERSRWEASKNLKWMSMNSEDFSGELKEAWVRLHRLNLRFWETALGLNKDWKFENVAQLKEDLDRLSEIIEIALAAADEGRYTMSVVIRSYELLAATICFCVAHREVEENHEWFSTFTPAFDPKDLDHLVLDDKVAIEATTQVRQFLCSRRRGNSVPFRNHQVTMDVAKLFVSGASSRALDNWEVHRRFLEFSTQMIDDRWNKISKQKAKLSKLDAALKQAECALYSAQEERELAEGRVHWEHYWKHPIYCEAEQRVANAEHIVRHYKSQIIGLNKKPANLVFSLPEDDDAELLLFFIFMESDFRHLIELAHRAECLLWEKSIPKTKKKGQNLHSWLSESCGLGHLEVSQGMIQLCCPSLREVKKSTPGIRNYERMSGVFFPKFENFSLGWTKSSPFVGRGQDSIPLFTEKFNERSASKQLSDLLIVSSSPSRENIAPAKPELKPEWLTREQYNAFASLRAAGRTQLRSLLNALFEDLLPLDNPCVHILIQQVVFQIGGGDWKTDLKPKWNGLEAMEVFWRRKVFQLRDSPKSFEPLLLAGVISGFYGQFHEPLEEIAVEASGIFSRWASDILLEKRKIELIAKQARFYGFGVLCYASVKINFQRRLNLVRLLVLYRDRLVLSQSETDSALEQSVLKVMGTKWSFGETPFAKKNRDSSLTSLVQTVVESAPSDLKWVELVCTDGDSIACFQATRNDRLFSINLNNGIVLVNGLTKSFLPQSITSDSLFVRHFGQTNPEVSIEGLHHYRTTHKINGIFFYDFIIDANDQLHIFEFDSRREFDESERLKLLDPAHVPFQPHLVERHSHWLNSKQQWLVLRDTSIESRRISFVMQPGKLIVVPPSFQFASIEEIFENEGRFDIVLCGSTPFGELLNDTGFEETNFVAVTLNQGGNIKYSLPRYGLNFTQTIDGIRSDDFKGYHLIPEQQLSDTLPGFRTFLLLSNSDGENMVVVPCGEVLQVGEIRKQGYWGADMAFHVFRIHQRFHHLKSSNTLGRLHLACLYASTGSLIPDRRTGKTGMTIAVELLRQCFQNVCFSTGELAKLSNLLRFSHHSCALRLLVWCIYRWSNSLECPKLDQREFLQLDKLASEEYLASSSGPHLTSVEETTVFCFASAKKYSPVEENGSVFSLVESHAAQYIRMIEKDVFQPLLSCTKRNCAAELPLSILPNDRIGLDGKNIRGRVLTDLRESYQTYLELPVKSVNRLKVDFTGIKREVCCKRGSIEESVLQTLNDALQSRELFDFFAGSMRKYVSSDLLCMLFSTDLRDQLKPKEQTDRWVEEIESQVNGWALLCVFEDKIHRLERFSEQQKQEELVRELECTREWNPRQYPRWLAFEVEQQLQIRPEQFKTVDQLLTNPRGSVIQLNMGSGKTRVMVPMLVLELCRQKGKIARINVLPSILQEALLFYQQSLVASVQHTKLFTLPFVRDNQLDEYRAKVLDEEVRRCQMHGGCLIVTPQHRNSLLLKQHESNIYLKRMPKGRIVDILDESDAILEPSFQLVYAMGMKKDLPSRPNRCAVFQSLLIALSRGECKNTLILLEDPSFFCKEDSRCGCFSSVRVLNLSASHKSHLATELAEHFVSSPSSGFEWLQKVKQQRDVGLLVRMISDPKYQHTSRDIADCPLFSQFKDDILAARGFLAYGVLLHCLEARWGVSYGLRHLQNSDTRMAVPYAASDTPKLRAEFSHPDVAIAYTNLSYLHEGLTKEQFRTALGLLDSKGLSVKLSTYAVWIEKIRADVPIEELQRFNTYEKVDPCNLPQFELMHLRLNRCMEVVFFWLNEAVFPVETMQYPQRLISSAWNLVESGYAIGFSGTDDNRFLLPIQVKQIQHVDRELRATNGRMVDLVLSCTKEIHQLDSGPSAMWETVLNKCFDNLKVQALIDAGGLMAGSKTDSVIGFVATKLKSAQSDFGGFIYYSTDRERWEVFEVATGRTHSIARSSLAACDCFVFFDESRCRGTDFKLRRDAVALVTLDSRVTKDKFLQGCARMRQLFPGGQSLILAGTEEVVAENSTPLSVLNAIVESGIKTVESGLRTYVQRARDFDLFPRPVDDNFELNEMYSKSFVMNESFHKYLENSEEVQCTESAMLNNVINHAKSVGDGVVVNGGVGIEECEKEVHAQSEQDQQREIQVTSQIPRSQLGWDYRLLFKDPNRLFLSHFSLLKSWIFRYGHEEMRSIRWSDKVYCTRNFWETIEKAEECIGLSSFLRLVDPLLVFPDGRVVLISLYELDNLLPIWWGLPSKPTVSIDHVFRLVSDCPPLRMLWSNPVSKETLVSIKLFRGDVKYDSDEEKLYLRQLLRDLERPVNTVKQLLSARDRLSYYEQSELDKEAYLLSLPNSGTNKLHPFVFDTSLSDGQSGLVIDGIIPSVPSFSIRNSPQQRQSRRKKRHTQPFFANPKKASSGFGGFGTLPPALSVLSAPKDPNRGTKFTKFVAETKEDGSGTINLQSISAMVPYENRSFEELRFEDYSQGNRGMNVLYTVPSFDISKNQGLHLFGAQKPDQQSGLDDGTFLSSLSISGETSQKLVPGFRFGLQSNKLGESGTTPFKFPAPFANSTTNGNQNPGFTFGVQESIKRSDGQNDSAKETNPPIFVPPSSVTKKKTTPFKFPAPFANSTTNGNQNPGFTFGVQESNGQSLGTNKSQFHGFTFGFQGSDGQSDSAKEANPPIFVPPSSVTKKKTTPFKFPAPFANSTTKGNQNPGFTFGVQEANGQSPGTNKSQVDGFTFDVKRSDGQSDSAKEANPPIFVPPISGTKKKQN